MKIELDLTANQQKFLLQRLIDALISGESRQDEPPFFRPYLDKAKEAAEKAHRKASKRAAKKADKKARKKIISYKAPRKRPGDTAASLVNKLISSLEKGDTLTRAEVYDHLCKKFGRKLSFTAADVPLRTHVQEIKDLVRIRRGVFKRVK